MDACHILLGRPWLFDRRVLHDGFLNTYTFTKDGKKITLAPLSPSQLTKSKPQKSQDQTNMLLTLGEPFLKTSQHEFKALREWLLLSLEEAETSPPQIHPLATSLLEQFSHVFPEDIPHDHPPKRTIQHHIHLIPGAILPNKSTYRMNPKETMEIQRQVDELIAKGLVRESLSPCVVPTLLVQRKMVQ